MTTNFLIDTEKLSFLKAADGKDSVKKLDYWADILVPASNTYIAGDSKKYLSIFSRMELKLLYKNTTGKEITSDDYPRISHLVYEEMVKTPIDNTSIADLKIKLGKELEPVSPLPAVKEVYKPKKTAYEFKPSIGVVPKTGTSRPKAGSTTGKVWDIADKVEKESGLEGKPLRSAIINACEAAEINSSTAGTQYAKWRKAKVSEKESAKNTVTDEV